jgi:ribonuclease HII
MISPTVLFEKQLKKQGHKIIIGIDEVGYGAIAGPVLACAVILKEQHPSPFFILDSKQLSEQKREKLFEKLKKEFCFMFAIGQASVLEIHMKGIREATNLALVRAIDQLGIQEDGYILLDGVVRPNFSLPCQTIIRGDQSILSIATASIIAKVTRDRLMRDLDTLFPCYGFSQHKGYGTLKHLQAILENGSCKFHRTDWKCFDERQIF